jgi:RNA polymerase-associated protein CTR9
MLAHLNERDRAHELLKDALTAQNGNLGLRAFYTHFLVSAGLLSAAQLFVFATLKDHDKHDLYALCAAGWLQHTIARENKDAGPGGADARRRGFRRSAEFYLKALALDAGCAVAAQGLAIASAEDALGAGGALAGAGGSEAAQRRLDGAREALEVFAKVREARADGSVYVNMGHCYFARDQLDRAIESVRGFFFIRYVGG